ncbi:MAG: hypothetical protein C0501_08110 [Isosphaera sp.]|nr:hypothetical protein [Isosphaera sp.]
MTHAVHDELDAALGRVGHCLAQLTDEQVWWRPRPDLNAVGNLVLHLVGNLNQLIGSGVGGRPDDRDRPAEFAARGAVSGDELLGRLVLAVKRAKEEVSAAGDEALCGPIPVTKFDFTGLQAVVRSVAHFRGHTQEIIHLTRTILGDGYRFAGPQ